MGRAVALAGYRERVAGLTVALLVHAALLLLALAAAPQMVSPANETVLRVFDVMPPPPALPVVLPEPVPPPPVPDNSVTERSANTPAPDGGRAQARMALPDMTPVVDAPPTMTDQPSAATTLGDAPVGTGRGDRMGQGDGNGAGNGDGDGAKPMRWARTEWIVRPSTRSFYANWPRVALANKESGEAVLSCMIAASGRPRRCVVLSEAPAGAGFGAAALRMAPGFRIQPVRRNGRAVDMPVLVPLGFKYSEEQK